jgi:hypothetical protein
MPLKLYMMVGEGINVIGLSVFGYSLIPQYRNTRIPNMGHSSEFTNFTMNQ